MLPIKKQIVTDEAMSPVAVLIDYRDWQKIEKILENYRSPNEAIEVEEKLPETTSPAVDTSPEETGDNNKKNKSDRIILPPATTEVKFTLSMLPEIPGIHREEAENKAKEAYVMTLLRHHDISAGRAAELLGINRWNSRI